MRPPINLRSIFNSNSYGGNAFGNSFFNFGGGNSINLSQNGIRLNVREGGLRLSPSLYQYGNNPAQFRLNGSFYPEGGYYGRNAIHFNHNEVGGISRNNVRLNLGGSGFRLNPSIYQYGDNPAQFRLNGSFYGPGGYGYQGPYRNGFGYGGGGFSGESGYSGPSGIYNQGGFRGQLNFGGGLGFPLNPSYLNRGMNTNPPYFLTPNQLRPNYGPPPYLQQPLPIQQPNVRATPPAEPQPPEVTQALQERNARRNAAVIGTPHFERQENEMPMNFTDSVKGIFGVLNKFLDVFFEFFRDPEEAQFKAKLFFPTNEKEQRLSDTQDRWRGTTTENYIKMMDNEGPGLTRTRRQTSQSNPTAVSANSRNAFNQAAPNISVPHVNTPSISNNGPVSPSNAFNQAAPNNTSVPHVNTPSLPQSSTPPTNTPPVPPSPSGTTP